jgi:peptidoglycan DL-endopeptidase CwlO
VLSATRHRVIPATLLVSGAVSAGLVGSTLPAQAATAPTSVAPATATVATVAPLAVRPAAVPTAAQLKAAAIRRQVSAALAAQRVAAMRVMRVRADAVHVARSKVGARYVAGHAGPTKFDCSGLALYVVKRATGRSLPHYSKAQFRATSRVAKSQLRPGDLVFFFRHGAHHVGIYIGRGLMISATNPSGGVRVDSVFGGWYGSRYSGAGRLV